MTNRKKGVSLIAVLLFMLVATIAATATFKWLNSEGRSSADRLMLSEARQSAVAGIETARSWMTYHGNETGALVKQYLGNGKTPILLDSLLSPMTNGQQKFSVMLVGVDISNPTYKLKIASTGTARNGTTFSEEAIMNVNGLYRVAIPTTQSTLDFNYALFSSSVTYNGTVKIESAVINGNWYKNPPITTGDFVVTGNAELSGSSLNIGGTACIAGNLDANNGISSNNLYVKGNVVGTALSVSTTGNVYLDGKITAGSQAVYFGGNLTLADTAITNLGANNFDVEGNLCIEDEGAIQINGTGRDFHVNGNVWIPTPHLPFLSGSGLLSSGNYSRIVLGDTATDKIYVEGARSSNAYAAFRDSKCFVESSSYRKNCPSGFNPEGNFDGWCNNGDSRWECGGVYDQHFYFTENTIAAGEHQACGTMQKNTVWQNTAAYQKGTSSGHMGVFSENWNYWGNGTYCPYDDNITAANDKYYIYYNSPDTVDVEFREYDNTYWKHYEGPYGKSADGNFYVDKENFSSYFKYPTKIGAYYVGGQVFFDMWDTYAPDYRYVNGKPTGSPYCYNPGGSRSNPIYQPKCAISQWFKALGTVNGTLPTTKPFECGESAKAHCDSIWGPPKTGCNGAAYKVDDPIITAYSSFVLKANNLECSKDIHTLTDANVTALNTCYNNTKNSADSTKLYNGFLVVEMYGGKSGGPKNALTGDFIFIYKTKAGDGNQFKIGPSEGNVFMYLEQGSSSLQPANCSGSFKYFIYSLEDIDEINGFDETSCQLKGSVYATAENCKKVQNASGKGLFLKTDKGLIDKLGQAAILCPSESGSCGTVAPSSSEDPSASMTTTITYSGDDTDFIATGSQLSITMESQYKNEETYEDAQEVEPSIVVLPRIIYLNSDAIGKLSDYYTVMPLNGAVANGSGSVTCPEGAPPTSSPFAASDSLNGGFYYCTYTENGLSSSFHIVVSGKMSETPYVNLGGDESGELNGTVENLKEVKLVVSKVAAASTTPITVNISVSKIPATGWTLTPTSDASLTVLSESSGAIVYSYSTLPSTSEAKEISLFTLKTEPGAQTGTVSFMLQNPSNCIISAPMYTSFSIVGSSTVERAELSQYCTDFPDNCTEAGGATYGAVKDHENCDAVGIWITVSGDACSAEENNKKWTCATGIPLSLEAMSYDHDLCEAYIPTANNSVTSAKNDSVYTLYGSLKKRMYNLHLSFSGSNNSGSGIKVRSKTNATSSFEDVETCTTSSGCDYSFYAGRIVEIEAVSTADDKFSYWTCLGGKCSSINSTSTTVQLVMTSNYDYEAKYNEIDPHCFYTEFDDIKAFCSGVDETECIDKCDGSTHCNSGGGKYGTTPNWLMAYANQSGNSFIAPEKLGGYISYNGNATSGNQTILLNRVIAGNNGTMTARIMSDQFSSTKAGSFTNSGFILRSNVDATSYLVMNIYGKDGYGTYARICYASDQSVDNSKCIEKQVRSGSSSSPALSNNMEPINVTINLNASTVDVALNFMRSSQQASASFDLAEDWEYGDLNDLTHRYVGLMLTDKEFKVSDIGWHATDFPNEACFDYPSISCSFAANYLGGKVPLDSAVMPWVGFSSWYSSHDDCISSGIKYYYNGCDMSSSQFVSRSSNLSSACSELYSDGWYQNDTLPNEGLELSGDYKFEWTGMHGIASSDNKGHIRNAFVSVSCTDASVTSNSGCGEFFVGQMTECSKNEMIVSSEYSGSTSQRTVTLDNAINLRGATINIGIESLADGENIEVVLEDSYGMQSPARLVTKTNHELDASSFEALSSFNLEAVKKVLLTGSASYTLNVVNSRCPNAVNIGNCHATYGGSQWTITSNISHVDHAYKCRVKPNSMDMASPDSLVECTGMSFNVRDDDFYERLNISSAEEMNYSFTVEVFDEENPGIGAVPADTCIAVSDSYKHATATCSIEKDMVLQGDGVPKLTYSIKDCPDYGCKYSVELYGKATKTNSPPKIPQDGVTGQEWQPDVNTSTDEFAVGSYTYEVKAWNKDSSRVIAECAEDDVKFNVEEKKDIQGTCSISGSYITVSIDGANYGESSSVSLAMGDVLGNILNFSTIAVGASKDTTIDLSSRTDLTPGQAYTFMLHLRDSVVTCGSYTKPYEIGLTCPANVTGQKAEEALTVTPTVSGCGSACSWSLTGGSVSLSGTDYNGGALTPFTSEGSDGTTVSYTIQLSRTGAAKDTSCTFTVQYKENTNITATCAWDNGTGTYWPGQSNVKLNVSNIRNLPSDQKFELTCGDRSTSSTCRVGGNCDNLQFKVPSTVGNYTCILQNSSGDVMCRPAMEIKAPLNCSVSSNAVGYGETFTFSGSTASGTNCWNCRWSDGSSSHSVGTSFSQNITFNYTTERTYTFQCDCSEMDSPQKCTQTVVSHLDPPTVTCPTTHYTSDPGQNITFTPASLTKNCGIGCNYTLVKDGSSTPKASKTDNSYTSASAITFTGDMAAGSVKYTFDVTNSAGHQSCDFYVDYNKPTIENCPTSAIDADPGSTITLPSTLTVGNCSSGNCKYSITGGGNTIAGLTTYSSSGTISFTGESAVGEKSYTLTISNGGPTPATCNFKVNYKAVSVSGCSPASKSVEPGESFDVTPTISHCGGNCWYSFDGGSTHHDYTGGDIPLSTDENGSTTNYTLTFGNNVSGNKGSCDVSVTYLKPEVTCPTTPTISVEPGGRASYDPGVSNCTQGCKFTLSKAGATLPESITSYTYTGGNISFVAGGSADPDTYSLIVTNKADQSATECKFDVGYKVPTFTCPTVSGSKAVGTNITVKPTDVRNCTNGCKYSIEAINGTGTGNTGLESYSSGADLGPVTESSAGTTTYALHLKNDAGYDAENCTFDVTYVVVTCTEITETITGDNYHLRIAMTDGCYEVNTGRACKHVQIQNTGSTGSGNFTINGVTVNCATYFDNDIPKKTIIKFDVPASCEIKTDQSIYLSGCEDISPRVNSCSVGATMLAADETTTFSATLSNVDSWILKKDGEQVDQGGSTSSISKTITGFGEYKLYLNGETTAKCTKTILEKPAGGVTTDLYCEYWMSSDNWPIHSSGTTIVCHNNGWCSAQNLECSGTFKYKVNGGSEQTFSGGSISCQDGSAVTITEGTGKCYLKN
ncbi:MAG: hypothetical protein MJY47_02325 [Fibrobacter sp.]|nr:hypothetical protein [Fibrobacter sp.]